MPSIQYGTETIQYEILRKPTLKHTYIQVNGEGVLVKTNRRSSEAEIEALVLKKAGWIYKHLEDYKKRSRVTEETIKSGSRLYYLGKQYCVVLSRESRQDIEVCFSHSKFFIKAPHRVTQRALREAIEAFYKENAQEKIIPLAKKWAKKMSVTPTKISFRKAKRQWGSCSSANRISFNYHLIKLSVPLIEYVVVHEFSHIYHKNHSAAFWKLVEKFMPDYRNRVEKIKEMERLL